DHGVRFVSDEIYHGIVDRPTATPSPVAGVCAWEIDRRSIVVSSFSKYWGMTGWRLGWTLVPDDLVDPVDAVAGNASLCAPVPAQNAALGAFEHRSYDECDGRLEDVMAARELLLDRLDELGWGEIAPPDGAFYLWADIGDQLQSHGDTGIWCRT